MNQRKSNIFLWSMLALAMLLIMLALIMATGNTWARYRTEIEATIPYTARTPLTVKVGQITRDETGEPVFEALETPPAWGNTEGKNQLRFALSNGTAESFEERTQQVRVRFIGSLGIQSGENIAVLTLSVPVEKPVEEPTAETETTAEETVAEEALAETQPETVDITATAVHIGEDSPLHKTFGDGWVFYFFNEKEEEVFWTLQGGKLSFVDMTVTVDGITLTDTHLQLQILTELE